MEDTEKTIDRAYMYRSVPTECDARSISALFWWRPHGDEYFRPGTDSQPVIRNTAWATSFSVMTSTKANALPSGGINVTFSRAGAKANPLRLPPLFWTSQTAVV